MELAKLDINGTPFVGIYVALNNDVAIIPNLVSEKEEKVIENILNVKCIRYNIANSSMNGVMCKLFNKKIILSKISTKEDVAFFKEQGFDVLVLDSYFAVGNLIATDQETVVVSKEFDAKTVKKLEDFLEVKVTSFQVGELPAIGSYLLVNKKGFAIIPDADTKDIKKIEKIFGVKGNIATINFGDNFISNGVLITNHGMIVGKATTGYELIRINDIFFV